MHTCIYVRGTCIMGQSFVSPVQRGQNGTEVPGLNIGLVPAVPEICLSIVSLRGPWLLAGTS